MRRFPLHYLNDTEFEVLANLICRIILGEGVTPFTKGPDGGKDGKFKGRANRYPSEANPWDGKIIIQAKHTTKADSSCSDSDFKNILQNNVIPSIKKLKENEEIDYYLLFTNRKLTGLQDPKIESLIDIETNTPNAVIAYDRIMMFLKTYPQIVREARLNDLLTPLQFNEDDLKELILEFHKIVSNIDDIEVDDIDFRYIEMSKKNELNDLSKAYFDNVMMESYNYFDTIRLFLSDPINIELKGLYKDIVDDLNAKITIKRNEYSTFEVILDDLYNRVANSSNELRGNKRLIRLFLNYMYLNCDIGRKDA